MDEFDYDVADTHLICDNVVRTRSTVDVVVGLAEVVGQGVGGGDGVLAGLDVDGAGSPLPT